MARNTTRVGRRRRVLNEEVLSASNIAIHTGATDSDIEPGDTPRYGAGANIENHPQVTSFVPRRYRTLCAIAIVGVGVSVTAELVAHYAVPLSELSQVLSAEEITTAFSDRLVAWTSATLLLLTAGYTRLIYSLRRHRVDDNRGLYRVWRTAGWAAIALSINAVVGAHELAARCLGYIVEWQVLPASAGWWLVPATLLGGWLLIKLILDASECRGAMSVYIMAAVCFVIAGAHSAGWSPSLTAEWPGVLSRATPQVGFTFLLVGSLLFARYVILDVQGLIDHEVVVAPTAVHEQNSEEQHIEEAKVEVAAAPVVEEYEETPVSSSNWVDGTEPEIDYDDEPSRKLSKAERKRLRKQKNRSRAA